MRLIGLLVTVVILGILSYIVLQSTQDSTESSLSPLTDPAAVDPAAGTTPPASVLSPVGAANQAACGADAAALSSLEEQYFAINGVYADMATLVGSGSLDESSPFHDVVLTAGGTGFTLVGRSGCPDP